jgi:integrase
MQSNNIRLTWDGQTYRGDGYVLGKRIRKSFKIRSKSQEKLARKAIDHLFQQEYIKGLERNKVNDTALFSTAALNYIIETGYNRYAAYLEKILMILGPTVRIGELNKSTLCRLGAEKLPSYSQGSIMDCFVKPVLTIIRHALGDRRKPLSKKARPVRVLTVSEVLRLLDTAANDPSVLQWDPNRHTLQKIVFQLGGGASPGETCVVKAADFDAEHKRVLIAGRDPGGQKNEGRVRYVYLPDFYWNLLKGIPNDGYAFRTPRGEPYALRKFSGGQYSGAFASVVRAAGLSPDITPHCLRHTFASHFYAATLNIKALQKLGGWASHDIPLSTYVELLPASTADELLAASIDYGQVLDRLAWRGA